MLHGSQFHMEIRFRYSLAKVAKGRLVVVIVPTRWASAIWANKDDMLGSELGVVKPVKEGANLERAQKFARAPCSYLSGVDLCAALGGVNATADSIGSHVES